MAGIPYVSDPAQMLWQFQQDQARTNLLNSQTEETKATTAQRIMETMMKQRVLNSDLALQDAMNGPTQIAPTMMQQDQQQTTPATPDMGADQFMQDMGGPALRAPPQPIPQDRTTSSPIVQAQQLIDQRTQAANKLMALADTKGIIPERALDLRKQAQDMFKFIQDDRAKLADQQAKQLEQIGGIAGAAAQTGTTQALQMAVRQLNAVDPSIAQRLPFDRDPYTFEPLPTGNTFNALKNLGMMSMKQSEQLTAQKDAMRLQQEAANAEETARHHVQEEEQARQNRISQDANTAATREATFSQHQIANADRGERLQQTASAQASLIGQRLESDPAVKAFSDKKNAFMAATNYILDENGQPKKSLGDFTSPEDFAFAKQYLDVVHPKLSGGVQDAKALAALSNLPERITSSFVGLAKGKIIPADVKADMYTAMQNVIKTDNQRVLDLEDKALAQVNAVPGLPSSVPREIYIKSLAIRPPASAPVTGSVDYADLGGVKVQGRGTQTMPYQVDNDQQFSALPSKAYFRHPDGTLRQKP